MKLKKKRKTISGAEDLFLLYYFCQVSVYLSSSPFFPEVVCCVKNVDYQDVSPWQVNPRNIIDSFFTIFCGVWICQSGSILGVLCTV